MHVDKHYLSIRYGRLLFLLTLVKIVIVTKYTYGKLSIRAFLRLFMYTYNTGMKYDLLLCKQSM